MGQSSLEDGKPIGGTGSLRQGEIYQLQVLNRRAIRDNTHDIQSMQDAVIAAWYHTQSTEEIPNHDLCPPEENSL